MAPSPTLVVVGCSAGGLHALHVLLAGLASDFPLPVAVVCHTGSDDVTLLCELLGRTSALPVVEAAERRAPVLGTVHIAPSGYHLLIGDDGRFALSVDARVGFARPSIDVLFESAAAYGGPRIVGVIMTGANSDGAQGLKRVREGGGVAIVQDPSDAEVDHMPAAALAVAGADHCVPLREIASLLNRIVKLGGR
jgi:two-component system, chemotaxis family, protein-glutamate methylesterase/glutaminase